MRALVHRVGGCEGLAYALEPDFGAALDEDAKRAARRDRHLGGSRENILGDTVPDELHSGGGAHLLERVSNPARLSQKRDRQIVRKRSAGALSLPVSVEAFLQRLDE